MDDAALPSNVSDNGASVEESGSEDEWHADEHDGLDFSELSAFDKELLALDDNSLLYLVRVSYLLSQ